MHVEIRFDFPTLFLEQHRQEETRTKPATQCREQSRATAGPEFRRRMTVLIEEFCPDDYVAVFDIREPGIDVFLLGVGFGGGEQSVQIRCVGFVLPVVLERVDIERAVAWRRLAGLERRGHYSISPGKAAFAPVGQPCDRHRCPTSQNHDLEIR